ncbi:MAG TPA: metallophosphoesterase [Candidatus Dormibacteraeota bacterium]|nr:metallophosphoesterase [Candidatus Dormibacteraeota bacterium]
MPNEDKAAIQEELREEYAKFRASASPEERAAIDRVLQTAHRQANDVLEGTPEQPVKYPSFATAWSTIDADTQPPGGPAVELLGALDFMVDGQGLIWGPSRYLQLDAGWSKALVGFFKYRERHAPFGAAPQVIDIDEQSTLALAGDWGTEFWRPGTPAEMVRTQILRGAPKYTIHLGDVYYSGAEAEERAFVANWPRGRQGSFTLNSNHEMYSGGQTYFDVALADGGPFAHQRGTSFFALRSSKWLIFGLDTAYFSPSSNLYMDGIIDPTQQQFMRDTVDRSPGRRIAVLSHNEGFDLRGGPTNALWAQVEAGLGRAPDYWFWGHAHNAAVYKPRNNCRCRCIGHGAIPYGVASSLSSAPEVEWFEAETVPDDSLPRVLNGHLELILDGASIEEKFIGEDGSLRWTAFDAGS